MVMTLIYRKLCSVHTPEILVLGLHLDHVTDILTFRVKHEQEGEITKRKVILETSRVFDPLGFLSPSIILLKILFQKLWLTKIDWDDRLPQIKENTRYRFTNSSENVQIHGFADASEVAYCAVVYSRVIDDRGQIATHILASKTKVAPIKKISVPRLELCAAHLLVKLLYAVRQTITPNTKCYAWTDLTIVLAWLSAHPAKWKTFVANRVSQILEKFPRQHWSHVKSADNPADHGSRGLSPDRLVKMEQWWYGPRWLKQAEQCWPNSQIDSTKQKSIVDKELNKAKLQSFAFQVVIEENWIDSIVERKSSVIKIYRIVAYVKRFVRNAKIRNTKDRNRNELTAQEIEDAEVECVKWVQAKEYHEDINYLRRTKTIKCGSKLISLVPFIDAMSILRVKGRLTNAEEDYDVKHPIILPAKHIFTEKLIIETHHKNLHAGPTLTNNLIRQKYWIINGRSKIRSLLKNCVTCAKYSHKTSSQLMGSLPPERITPPLPFKNCGIDFAGPLYFATMKGRGGTNPIKGYLCVFVCLAIKAVHLEPVVETATLLCQIENILNSRPLCATSDGDNYEVLTPAHFLIGTLAGSVPEKSITTSDSLATRWQRIPARIQMFWSKYRIDYINNLQQRHKWQKASSELQINDIVLIKEDNTPVCKWPLCRIIQTHPGNYGLVRVITIKTSSTTLQRPITKICKLPVG